MSSTAPKRSMGTIVWCATFSETVRHAHLLGFRVCSKVQVGDTRHWLKIKRQPRRQCRECMKRLAKALQPPPPIAIASKEKSE